MNCSLEFDLLKKLKGENRPNLRKVRLTDVDLSYEKNDKEDCMDI